MQPRHFTLGRLVRAKASARAAAAEERTVLRINRELLKADEPKVVFETQA